MVVSSSGRDQRHLSFYVVARSRSGGATALVDRWSVRRTQRRTLCPQLLQLSVDLRHGRSMFGRAAMVLVEPLATVGRVLKALVLDQLMNLQPSELVCLYQLSRPGDIIHVDTKQLARFEQLDHVNYVYTVGSVLVFIAYSVE